MEGMWGGEAWREEAEVEAGGEEARAAKEILQDRVDDAVRTATADLERRLDELKGDLEEARGRSGEREGAREDPQDKRAKSFSTEKGCVLGGGAGALGELGLDFWRILQRHSGGGRHVFEVGSEPGGGD